LRYKNKNRVGTAMWVAELLGVTGEGVGFLSVTRAPYRKTFPKIATALKRQSRSKDQNNKR